MAARERQRHEAAARAADHARAVDVDPIVLRQHPLHREDVVEPVAAPVAVDACVLGAVPSSRGALGTNTAKPSSVSAWISGIENHAEVRPLLALRAAVDVVHERPRSFVAELVGGEIEARGHAQAVVRVEGRILAGGQQLGRESERALARPPCRRGVSIQDVELCGHRRRAERRREATALFVEVETVKDAVRELVLPDEHALERQLP